LPGRGECSVRITSGLSVGYFNRTKKRPKREAAAPQSAQRGGSGDQVFHNFAISCLTLIVMPEKGVSAMGIPTILKRHLSTLVLMLFASTLAMAQYDDGQYEILHARYGTARSNVDVTERLRELARQDLTFRMGNSTFGVDPDPGVIKILRIYARGRNGRTRTFEYTEGSTVDGSLFTSWDRGNWGHGEWNGGWDDRNGDGDEGQFEILHARYGTERSNVDVTERLRELARRDLTFRMGNSTFGVDPDPGVIKILRIYARGRNGPTRTFEYTEGSTVDGSLFAGWDNGNWGHGEWNGGWGDRNGDGDEGQYEILQARYGTARSNVDVTERLRELARQDLTFRMGNSTFGVDPDRGVLKILRIYARGRNGQDRMFEYTEGSTVDGSLFTGWIGGNWGRGEWNGGWGDGDNVRIGGDYTSLNIISATYGAGKQRRDVTDRVRSMVRDGRLHITVNNDTLGGDPAPDVRKALWVTYSTGRGRPQEVRVDEGERLSVP
jgi:hypothetical protein